MSIATINTIESNGLKSGVNNSGSDDGDQSSNSGFFSGTTFNTVVDDALVALPSILALISGQPIPAQTSSPSSQYTGTPQPAIQPQSQSALSGNVKWLSVAGVGILVVLVVALIIKMNR